VVILVNKGVRETYNEIMLMLFYWKARELMLFYWMTREVMLFYWMARETLTFNWDLLVY
jgi:hypothetical protein